MELEDGALVRLRRYREKADRTLALSREAEEAARQFSGKLFAGLGRAAEIGRQAGFEVEVGREKDLFTLRLTASPGAESVASFGPVPGAAAETDEDLMHEELSGYLLRPTGYSGRVLGWSADVGAGPCQVFAVYRDGVWKTKGVFVEKARGRVDDPDAVLDGFCLRILGRLVDLAAPTEWAGRKWAAGPYTTGDLLEGKPPPSKTRWLR